MDDGPSNHISSSCTVDIEEWISLMEKERQFYVSRKQTGRTFRSCLINRVPQRMLELDRKAYHPINLSIGPYHHGNPAFRALEEKKWNCLNYILKLNPDKKLLDYLELMESLEQQGRSCYPENLAMESDKFIKMLLLDGCFLLLAFHGIQETKVPSVGNTEVSLEYGNMHQKLEETARHNICEEPTLELTSRIKGTSVLVVQESQVADSNREDFKSVQLMQHKESHANPLQAGQRFGAPLFRDLLLLENQIPFFVVKGIYELFSGEVDSSNFCDRVGKNITHHIGNQIPVRETWRPNKYHHLLHYCHMYLRPTDDIEQPKKQHNWPASSHSGCEHTYNRINIDLATEETKTGNCQSSEFIKDGHQIYRWRRAEQYREAGIYFKKRPVDKHDQHNMLDIKFTNGLLEIPALIIDQNTGCLFKNIIAMEQTCPQYGNYFSSYCVFLSQVISRPGDVTLLARQGVLTHHMRSDEEVSTLLANLGKNVDIHLNGARYLKSVCRRMEEHYQSRVNRWMAWLWYNHFGNPWLSLAVLAATIMLLCTILQTFFAFLAYWNYSSPSTTA